MSTTTSSGADQLILKLQNFARLSQEDRAALAGLACGPSHEARPRRDIIREGDAPNAVRLILSGWACRYKELPDGRRQIVGFFIPGDFCDLNVYILKEMDHSIGAITRVTYTQIAPEEMERIIEARPASPAPCSGTNWSMPPRSASGCSMSASGPHASGSRI